MRRTRGTAAELILKTVTDAHPQGLTLAGLRERTDLPSGTVQDNVNALRKQGKIASFRANDGKMWICLPE